MTMAIGLTVKQRQILEYIIDFRQEKEMSPTLREIGDAFGMNSVRGVTVHLDALVRKGYLIRDRTSRSMRDIAPDPRIPASGESVRLPLIRGLRSGGILDKMTVGSHIVERYISLPEEIGGPATSNGFVIRVGATGVYSEPILPGDLLIVRPQNTSQPGELAVSSQDGEITVSRTGDGISPISHDFMTNTEILGRVVGMFRRY
jgi:repressor LexA